MTSLPLNKYKTWAKVPGTTSQKKWDTLLSKYGELAAEVLRRLVLADPEAFAYGGGRAYAVVDHEIGVLLHAAYFTTVRNVGRGIPKDRREFKTFAAAVRDAEGDRQALIYGVVTEINSTSLSPKYWDFYKAIIAAVSERTQEGGK